MGRGLLLDFASWAQDKGIPIHPLTTQNISLSDLKQVAAEQNVEFKQNDILFIRSGYVRALASLSAADATQYASATAIEAIGVTSGEEMLEWIWKEGFAAVAGDMIAFEALPFQSTAFSGCTSGSWQAGVCQLGNCLIWRN